MPRNFEIGFPFRNWLAISNLRSAISKLRKFANCAEHIHKDFLLLKLLPVSLWLVYLNRPNSANIASTYATMQINFKLQPRMTLIFLLLKSNALLSNAYGITSFSHYDSDCTFTWHTISVADLENLKGGGTQSIK